VRNIQVSLSIPAGVAVERISLLSPDQEQPRSLACAVRNQRAEFVVPALETYSLAVLQLK
jgi:hypothetical protein